MQAPFRGLIDLDRGAADGHPLHRRLYGQIRAAILGGRLPPGSTVPPSRAMAAELGISRTTVLAAVDQLVAEGYLETRRGAGTRVAAWRDDLARPRGDAAAGAGRPIAVPERWRALIAAGRSLPPSATPRPLQPSLPDLSLFPRAEWARALRKAALRARGGALAYGELAGHPELRAALARYLAEARNVALDPDGVVVLPSAQAALDLLARLFLTPGDIAWLEEPGYRGARAAFLNAGARIVPVPVDEDGIRPAAAPAGAVPRLVYVTPSHQYPLGHTLSLARRLELLEMADATDAVVIEDDYDNEFRYEDRPIAALQGLRANARVIYVGTFSKTLLPSLRLGYLVAPPAVADAIRHLQRNTGHLAPLAVQLALAEFLDDGRYRAHVRRMQATYRRRRDALLAALDSRLARALRPNRPKGGLQLAAHLPDGTDDRAVAAACRAAGVEVQPLSDFYLASPGRPGLLMGFAAWEEAEIDRAVVRMAEVIPAPLPAT